MKATLLRVIHALALVSEIDRRISALDADILGTLPSYEGDVRSQMAAWRRKLLPILTSERGAAWQEDVERILQSYESVRPLFQKRHELAWQKRKVLLDAARASHVHEADSRSDEDLLHALQQFAVCNLPLERGFFEELRSQLPEQSQ